MISNGCWLDLVGVKFKILLVGVVGLFVCLVGWLLGRVVVWLVWFFLEEIWLDFSHQKSCSSNSFPAVGWNNLRLVGTTCGPGKKNNSSSYTNQLFSSLDLWPPNTKCTGGHFMTPTTQTSCTLSWKFREIPSKHTMQHVLASTLNPPLKKKGWHFMTPNLPPPTPPAS